MTCSLYDVTRPLPPVLALPLDRMGAWQRDGVRTVCISRPGGLAFQAAAYDCRNGVTAPLLTARGDTQVMALEELAEAGAERGLW